MEKFIKPIVFKLKNVTSAYFSKILWKDFDFSIFKGDFIAIAGTNGSGKTTLIRYLAGLNTPYTGEIEFYNKNLSEYSPVELAKKRSFVTQSTSSKLTYLVREIIGMGLESGTSEHLSPADFSDKISEITSFFDIHHLQKRTFSTLSGGEKQKVMLARAFAQSKDVLLLDEPDASLDPGQSADFFKKLSNMAQINKSTVLVVTHNLDAIVRFFPKILLIDGQTFHFGHPVEILNEYARNVFKADVFLGENSKVGNYILIR